MEIIAINTTKKDPICDVIYIKAKSKKDFYKQITNLIEEKKLNVNWELYGNSFKHKWFI